MSDLDPAQKPDEMLVNGEVREDNQFEVNQGVGSEVVPAETIEVNPEVSAVVAASAEKEKPVIAAIPTDTVVSAQPQANAQIDAEQSTLVAAAAHTMGLKVKDIFVTFTDKVSAGKALFWKTLSGDMRTPAGTPA